MNEISALSSLADLSIEAKTKTEPKNNELGRDAFLQLMLAQMENQDPLSPKENSEFVAELAQFTSVENLDQLNNSFEKLSNNLMSGQALQATSLVGSAVSVPSDEATLRPEDLISGSIELPASSTDLKLTIFDESGALVDQIDLGYRAAGDVLFRWDGYNIEVDGELLDWQSSQAQGLPAGVYKFEAVATQNGEPTQLETSLSANVNSVTVAENGELILNLGGVGAVPMSSVKQFN